MKSDIWKIIYRKLWTSYVLSYIEIINIQWMEKYDKVIFNFYDYCKLIRFKIMKE